MYDITQWDIKDIYNAMVLWFSKDILRVTGITVRYVPYSTSQSSHSSLDSSVIGGMVNGRNAMTCIHE